MYMMFSGYNYYPCGGWEDFAGFYPTKEAALEAFAESSAYWMHLVVGCEKVYSTSKALQLRNK